MLNINYHNYNTALELS